MHLSLFRTWVWVGRIRRAQMSSLAKTGRVVKPWPDVAVSPAPSFSNSTAHRRVASADFLYRSIRATDGVAGCAERDVGTFRE